MMVSNMFDQIKAKLKELGYKMTPQRQAIIDCIVLPGPTLTALEVWEQVRLKHPEISLDTVYRNLNMLAEVGVVTPIAGVGKDGARYELVHTAYHHHHIVCLDCGKAACIEVCPINPHFLQTVKEQGYDLVRHNVELFGICRKCRAEREAICVK